ncbi:MAG TPA: hypothetical protein VF328_20630 [Mycobacterium sp.]
MSRRPYAPNAVPAASNNGKTTGPGGHSSFIDASTTLVMAVAMPTYMMVVPAARTVGLPLAGSTTAQIRR